MKGFVDPMLSQFYDIVTAQVASDLPKNVAHGLMGGVPPVVANVLTTTLTQNLTTLLTHSVTKGLVDRLGTSLPNTLGPILATTITENSSPVIARGLIQLVAPIVSDHLAKDFEMEISRSLPLLLFEKLTHSVTHAIVPALARSIGAPAQWQNYFCSWCLRGVYCAECFYLSKFYMPTLPPHAAHFSEWYAGYYAPYYANAIKQVDQLLNGKPT